MDPTHLREPYQFRAGNSGFVIPFVLNQVPGVLTKVSAEKRMQTFSWKHFNWTAAASAFLTVLFLDFLLEAINLVIFDTATASGGEKVLAVPFWIIHFIGFPLLIFLRHGSGETIGLIVIALIYLLGALFWSTIAGYTFNRKKNA